MCPLACVSTVFVHLNPSRHEHSVDGPRFVSWLPLNSSLHLASLPSERSAALLRPVILLYSLKHRALDLYVVIVMAKKYSHTALGKGFMYSQSSCYESQTFPSHCMPCQCSCCSFTHFSIALPGSISPSTLKFLQLLLFLMASAPFQSRRKCNEQRFSSSVTR